MGQGLENRRDLRQEAQLNPVLGQGLEYRHTLLQEALLNRVLGHGLEDRQKSAPRGAVEPCPQPNAVELSPKRKP